MATKLKDLKLDDAHATAILEKAIEYESFTEEMPTSKRERAKAAAEQVALMIDAWIDDEVTPDNEDEDVAAMGVAIQEIFDIAGVEIEGEGDDAEVSYVEPGDIPDGDEPEGDGDEGEAAVDIDDIIADYDELSASGKVKAIKALELDMEDDDDYNTAVALYEYEESQDKPSSRVLSWLDDLIPKDGEEGEGDGEDEPDEDESAEEAGGEGEWEQPWDRYDKQTAVEVKKALDKLMAKDELTAEMAQYVIDYEEGREKPPARKRIIDHAQKLMAELEGGGAAEEEEPEPAKPARSGRPSRAQRTRTTSTRRGRAAKEEEPEEDEVPASSNGAGIFVISGGEEDITAYGIYGAMGAVADLLAAGYEEVSVAAG